MNDEILICAFAGPHGLPHAAKFEVFEFEGEPAFKVLGVWRLPPELQQAADLPLYAVPDQHWDQMVEAHIDQIGPMFDEYLAERDPCGE